MTTRVFVRGIETYGFHGVSPEERALGHRFSIDLDACIQGDAEQTDELADTVDYSGLVEVALGVFRDAPNQLLERIARRIGDQLLAEFPRIRVVTVTVSKIAPPIPRVVHSAGATVTASREGVESG